MERVEKIVLKELGFENSSLKEIKNSVPYAAQMVWVLQREVLGISIKYISEYYSETMSYVINCIYDAYKEFSKDKKAERKYRTIRSRLPKCV